MQKIISGLIVSLSLVCIAEAAEPARVGDTTQQWLELQKSGEQAPTDARPLEGDVAQRNYARYLKSFEHAVPDQFPQGGEAK